MISRKICLIGSFAVGKTSLVEQFVYSIFSDSYLSTVGVKISKKVLRANNVDVTLMLWDLEGKDCFTEINTAYLRGCSGFFTVVDSTRKETLLEGLTLRAQVEDILGQVPNYLLINKVDLSEMNEITPADLASLRDAGIPYFETSAKTGKGVQDAFQSLALCML